MPPAVETQVLPTGLPGKSLGIFLMMDFEFFIVYFKNFKI